MVSAGWMDFVENIFESVFAVKGRMSEAFFQRCVPQGEDVFGRMELGGGDGGRVSSRHHLVRLPWFGSARTGSGGFLGKMKM